MNLQDLANLVLIRNHLSFLTNTERNIVTKDLLRTVGAMQSNIDKVFLNEVLKLDVANFEVEPIDAAPLNTVSDTNVNIKTNGNGDRYIVVDPSEPEKQLELNFEPKTHDTQPKGKKTTAVAKELSKEDKEIADKIAKAKKSVASKKKATGTFQRTNDGD